MERNNRRSSRFSYITGISFEDNSELAEENELENEIELQAKSDSSDKNKGTTIGIGHLAKNMANLMSYKRDKELMKKFLVKITVLPMTIAVVVVGIGLYIMVGYYFNIMMENSAEIILNEISELQKEMLQNTKVLSSITYESQIDEILLVRNGLVKA